MARAVTCSCSRRSSSRASVCTSSFGGNGTTSANSDASRRAERMSCRVRKSRSAHGRPADCQHIRLRGRGPVAQTWFLVAERLPGGFSKQSPAATALQNGATARDVFLLFPQEGTHGYRHFPARNQHLASVFVSDQTRPKDWHFTYDADLLRLRPRINAARFGFGGAGRCQPPAWLPPAWALKVVKGELPSYVPTIVTPSNQLMKPIF